MKRWLAGISLICVAFVSAPLSAQPEEQDYPEPPASIAHRIVDGRFELGDFEYLRGYFPEANEAEKAKYAKLTAWLEQCYAEGRARLDPKLDELGVALPEDHSFGASNICQQVVRGKRFEEFVSYEELANATRVARLVLDALTQSVTLARLLERRTRGEQMLRAAFSWGWVSEETRGVPQMNSAERTAFLALLSTEVIREDYSNTQWLKGVVAEQGWPTISKVGERGARNAWLLTQHADLDPVFQLRALRLMEPLVSEGDVSQRNFAYLYDRIMLKLSGKQRFGTQVKCEAGKRTPRPLEDPDRLDAIRAEMGMGTFAEYLEGFSSPCPA